MPKLQDTPHMVEEEIEQFLENFKYVSSLLDDHDIEVPREKSSLQGLGLLKTATSGSLSTNVSSASLSSSSLSPISPLESSFTTTTSFATTASTGLSNYGASPPFDIGISGEVYTNVLSRSSIYSSKSMGSFETAPMLFPVAETGVPIVKSYSGKGNILNPCCYSTCRVCETITLNSPINRRYTFQIIKFFVLAKHWGCVLYRSILFSCIKAFK